MTFGRKVTVKKSKSRPVERGDRAPGGRSEPQAAPRQDAATAARRVRAWLDGRLPTGRAGEADEAARPHRATTAARRARRRWRTALGRAWARMGSREVGSAPCAWRWPVTRRGQRQRQRPPHRGGLAARVLNF
jgi:hypothetical protein